ncbi:MULTISPECIES: choline-sulfatase [Marivita]|uniref:Choline-sulfatase n=1 Tax=Marivita cryptomonadis TaxID=505252 RepID=A0A9Q2NZB8_9RHOB|nr:MULTISPECIES: choline-sulfatase [Marivita]MCR9169288.1 choline-sulfatase [Paracoccaceae bacterium]MBM2324017.1 choline-sulfatase [Marivita cryptomonadis]MBM2333607.1 choline-sulfatase [Marivita cryptomonadis]MBM2343184.1 choline-sulfatase [Marivita cryptomonadis]MBM2347856.1 choline-sulfatase [Marivita cryptomonadis]
MAERGDCAQILTHATSCNSPICAPSRASFMAGRLCPDIDAYDNAAEFGASVPTIAHFMRSVGYDTTLCGKMHFIGPDQMHGFDERLTTDIYPANFAWAADWSKPVTSPSPSGASVRPVLEAGPCTRSMQMDFDEEVAFKAKQKIFDLARRPDDANPFFLVTSFTHPHPPFSAPQAFWDLYDPNEIDMPDVSRIPPEDLDPASQYLYFGHRRNRYNIDDDAVRRTRHAYYGMISYVDVLIGQVLQTLQETGLDENTIIIFASDHGEMLGERGMWYKMTMYEWSVRVPLIICGPEIDAGRREEIVSLADLAPSMAEMGGGIPSDIPVALAGTSLWRLTRDGHDPNWPNLAISDYSAGAAPGPIRMVRKDRWKYVDVCGYPPLLFDLEHDPDELNDLAGDEAHNDTVAGLRAIARDRHSPEDYKTRIEQSQRERIFLRGLSDASGTDPNWAYVAQDGDGDRFVRGGGLKHGAHATKFALQLPRQPEAPEQIDESASPDMIPEPDYSTAGQT